MSYLDEEYCDEEEEYQLISKGDKESEEVTKYTEQEHPYNSPIVLEVRYPNLSPSNYANTSTINTINSRKESSTSPNYILTVPATNTKVVANIKIPIFKGNGLEELEQNWFLYDVSWTV